MKRMIVNADDYGHTPGVAQGIRRAHLQGIVTSTRAMMNRPAAFAEVARTAELCPRLGVGVHLVLTSGVPELPPEQVPSLVLPDGHFPRLDAFIDRLPGLNLDEVSAEWHAQVEKFIQARGALPDHLDSHHHSSYFTAPLFERMLRLAEELGCPIRKPFAEMSAAGAEYLPAHLAGAPGYGYTPEQGQRLPLTTDKFITAFCDQGATLENLLHILREIRDDHHHETFELMCHPAVVNEELMAISDYNEPRGRELEILTSAEMKAAVKAAGIELISFGQLLKTWQAD